jgi:hypothetical protein
MYRLPIDFFNHIAALQPSLCAGSSYRLIYVFNNLRQVIENMVARDGVEPPTPAFSGLRSTT